MTPHKSGGRGTYMLDRRLRIGRLTVASGTTHLPTFRRLNSMITILDETGRSDLLRAIRDHDLKPLAVYEAFRVNELHKLPTGADLKPLLAAMTAWRVGVDCSAPQKAAHKTAITKLASGTVADLPTNLQAYRETCRKAKTPAQFNRVRASCLAFIRDTLKRSHRLYGEVRDIQPMKERKAPLKQPQTWEQMLAHSEKITDKRDNAALWAMVLTGMGPKEYYVDGFVVLADRVEIRGVKREKRKRVVPRLLPGYYLKIMPSASVSPTREMRRFGERLYALAGIHSYDLRRTYANWLEAAEIPRTRRKMYLGHAGGDVTSLYEQHEVKQFLSDDALKLERYLSSTERKGLEVVK